MIETPISINVIKVLYKKMLNKEKIDDVETFVSNLFNDIVYEYPYTESADITLDVWDIICIYGCSKNIRNYYYNRITKHLPEPAKSYIRTLYLELGKTTTFFSVLNMDVLRNTISYWENNHEDLKSRIKGKLLDGKIDIQIH